MKPGTPLIEECVPSTKVILKCFRKRRKACTVQRSHRGLHICRDPQRRKKEGNPCSPATAPGATEEDDNSTSVAPGTAAHTSRDRADDGRLQDGKISTGTSPWYGVLINVSYPSRLLVRYELTPCIVQA